MIETEFLNKITDYSFQIFNVYKCKKINFIRT